MITKMIQVENLDANELSKIIAEKLLLKIEKYIEEHATKQNEELLTRQELSKYLKVSIATISNWSKCGVLKPYRLGTKIRFKKSEIQDSLIRISY